jgi:hypothetical protein
MSVLYFFCVLLVLSNERQYLCFGLVASYSKIWKVLIVHIFYRPLNHDSALAA